MNNPPRTGFQPKIANGWGRQWLWVLAVIAGSWPVQAAISHPLGEQSVDHYSQVEIAPGKIIVVYDEDMAEVATFQAIKQLDANGDGILDDAEKRSYADAQAREQASHLHLEINGRAFSLAPTTAKVFIIPGQTALPTLRLITTLETAPGALSAALRGTRSQAGVYRDDNEPNRIGWRQIGIQGLGTEILDQSINGSPATLSPQGFAMDGEGNQSDVRSVAFDFLPAAAGTAPPVAAAPKAIEPRQRASDSFASLMTSDHLTVTRMGWLLVLAAALGGLHALSPGHGKTLVAAYLVGSRGTAWHALVLGLIVTFTHTAGVFALGLVTLFASRYLLPDTLYPWLTAISGLVIALVGLLRLFGRGSFHSHEHGDDHEHGEDHEHGVAHSHADVLHHQHAHAHPHGGHAHEHGEHQHHEHEHEHHHEQDGQVHAHEEHEHHDTGHRHGHHHHHHFPVTGEAITWRSLLALGVSGGLVPCPSALVVLLSAVALHQIGFGLALIVAFSAGLAVVLTVIGLAMVYARDFVGRRFTVSPLWLQLVPKVGAALIIGIGLAIALPAVIILARRF